LISDGEVAIISAPLYAQYLSIEYRHQGVMNSPCSLEENLVYGSLVAFFDKEIHW
jgi:hypothetical protein